MIKHIKLFSTDGQIVGVEKINEPEFVQWLESAQQITRCEEREAQGIISADNSTIYQLDNKQKIESSEVSLTASFIDEIEYDCLVNQFDDPKEEIPEELPDEEKKKYMTAPEMRARIIALEKAVTEGNGSPIINDEATANFYKTLADSSTNSIAKIRAAAQQYLDDTSNMEESEG